MVWPVTMKYTQDANSGEVILTATDSGAFEKGERAERTLLRRIYQNATDAYNALVKPDNGLSNALWSSYTTGYEISDVGIIIDDVNFSSTDDYEDTEGNLKFDDFDLDAIKAAFEFNNFDKVFAYKPVEFSRSEIITVANSVLKNMQKPFAEPTVIVNEFLGYVSTDEAKSKSMREVIEHLADCGAFDYTT